jgi:hypothetical protein
MAADIGNFPDESRQAGGGAATCYQGAGPRCGGRRERFGRPPPPFFSNGINRRIQEMTLAPGPASCYFPPRNPGNGGRIEMTPAERRKSDVKFVAALKRELNSDQRMALVELEKFGWELKFIRRPMFQQPVPVVFDSDRKNYAVLNTDGTLDEKPGFDIRK